MAIGREWGRIRRLGRGSSATVSLAVDSSSGEVFAVKSSGGTCAGMLKREQRILSGLSSPYVVSYLGFDVAADGGCHLFMEYAPGGCLADEIKKQGGRLEERAVRCRAYEILRGLSYLHGRGIVHCDVKSQNVLIGSGGQAKIADFGCSKLVIEEEEDGNRFGGELRGTPMFMAPEVARGEEQGMPADVWALGCTVVEMATGELPWPAFSDAISVLHHIGFSSQVPKSPEWISEEGKDFLSKCLTRDPNERWTAEQLLHHPFLNCLQPKTCANDFWVSPKSTLDHEFWSSFSSEEEDQEEEEDLPIVEFPTEDPPTRLRDLSGDGEFADPNWTWDESWVTIRSNGDIQNLGASTSRVEEFMFSTNHMYSEDFQYNPQDFNSVSDSNCEDGSEKTQLLTCRLEFNFCTISDNNSNTRSKAFYSPWLFYFVLLINDQSRTIYEHRYY
ncbi:mitogen-activated protein kinase kinase kinase 18-like [Typha angustifolia]|uniref:mitogen-activated protein kinase kinase kinase 18-like n=1 Tax=Typha angustifolia TaxID=59011 RepID=UPI003C2D6A49